MIPGPELFQRIVAALTSRTRFYGFYLYEAFVDATPPVHRPTPPPVGTTLLVAVESFDGLPATILADQLYIPKAYGIPGTTATLALGTIVGVGFMGGNPARPFVAFYLPAQPLPIEVNINASAAIRFGDPLAQFKAARADTTNSNDSVLRNRINLLITAVNTATGSAIPPIGTLDDASSLRVSID